MSNYLREQTAGEIIRNSFAIFGKHFVVIVLTFSLPMLPFYIWQSEAQAGRHPFWFGLGIVAGMIAVAPTGGAITICLSQICLGNRPSVLQSYRKVFGLFGKIFSATLLQTIFILAGVVLLFAPALWFLFAPCVVVLENIGGYAALQRSRSLARGYNWRNFGVLLAISIVLIVIYAILAIILLLLQPGAAQELSGRLFGVLFQALSLPLLSIAAVLLYYDLRVRKEAYDSAALAEDLRR